MKYSATLKNMLFRSAAMPYSGLNSKGRHVAILRYHSIHDGNNNDYVSPNITLSPIQFQRQIRYFSRKYRIVSMDMVADCIRNRKPFPKKAVAVTFDDGYRDNYIAYQILKKFGAIGTFYVVAGCIGQGEPLWLFEVIYLIRNTARKECELFVSGRTVSLPLSSEMQKRTAMRKVNKLIKSNDRPVREIVLEQLRSELSDVSGLDKRASQIMLSWEQLKEMDRNGMTIGGHTMTHLNLPNAACEDARREIIDCRKLLEEKLQTPVLHFSYPNGGDYAYYNQEIVKMVKEAGYRSSTTSNNGLAVLESDAFELSRIRTNPNLPEIYYQIEWEPFMDKIFK